MHLLVKCSLELSSSHTQTAVSSFGTEKPSPGQLMECSSDFHCLVSCLSEPSSLPSPDGSEGKKSAHNLGGPEFDPWVREDPLEKEWLLTPVFLLGEFHGQRSLAVVHVGPKELDMTEGLTHTCPFHCISIFSATL